MLYTILIVVLILLLLGALPTWPYSGDWGYYPAGGLGLVVVIVIVLLLMGTALVRPDPRVTPGAINPAVTQENIGQTICVPGWSKIVRPPAHYTSNIKSRQLAALGLPHRMRDYELDHLIPIEAGGSPDSLQNMWPEPFYPADAPDWGADRKDVLEDRLHHLVCNGQLPLSEAQTAISSDWIAAYQQYVGSP